MFSRLFDPMAILYSLPAIFLALSFHEFAHALVADRLGDPTPRNQGRLTLDPFTHIDPVGLIFFILAGFGWAKPVQVNPSRFKNPRLGDILVSSAGPFANLLLAFIALGLFNYIEGVLGYSNEIFSEIMWPVVNLNLILFIFNFLPIPPLDGYHVVKSFFYRRNIKLFWKLEQYGFLILILISFTGILQILLSQGVGIVFQMMNRFYHIFLF